MIFKAQHRALGAVDVAAATIDEDEAIVAMQPPLADKAARLAA